MNAADIAKALSPNGRLISTGGGWYSCPCVAPGHGAGRGDRRPSMSIKDGNRAVLVVKCFAGCDPALDILPELRRLGYLDEVRPKRPALDFGDSDAARTARALALWGEARPIRGTLAERYLRNRRLDLPPDGLRYLADCPFGPKTRLPCMLGLFRNIVTDAPQAIHRTALTADGRKLGKPKMLGPVGGAAVKLWPDADVTVALAIGEGIETTIGGAMFGYRPAWALGSAGGIELFPVLPGIETLTILVDNDPNGRGQDAANTCSRRWTAAGKPEVFRTVPPPGADMADCL